MVNDFDYSGIDYHFGTEQTGAVCSVESSSFDCDSVIGGLNDGILFGVTAETLVQVASGGGI